MSIFRRNFNNLIIPPRNLGREKSVQQELDWTIARANAQYQSAFYPDSVLVYIWKKTDEGNFCTCRYGRALVDKIGSDNITNKPVVIAPEPTTDLEESKVNNDLYTVRNQWDDKVGDYEQIPELKAINQDKYSKKPLDTDNDVVLTEDEDSFLSAPVSADTTSGMERSQCGICLGQGKNQAWSLYGGRREVFDTYNVQSMQNFRVDTDDRPYSFHGQLNAQNFVEWHYTLPTYFERILNFAVRNNTKSVRYLKIFYKIEGSSDDFQRLTEDFLMSRRSQSTKLILRVQPIITDLETDIRFTHIEMSWAFIEMPRIQMGTLSIASNSQIAAVATTSSFTFPPNIDNLDRDYVFLDTKYGYMWTITDYTDFESASRQILGWTVSARNMQAFEQRSLLKVAYDKYYETSYAGLERVQGSLFSASDLLR